mgnify:CR=1 FL=1
MLSAITKPTELIVDIQNNAKILTEPFRFSTANRTVCCTPSTVQRQNYRMEKQS